MRARAKEKFPYTITQMKNVWIPLSDGTRLSARIWLPTSAKVTPVPAILEYLPYRKGDGLAIRDSRVHPYFAGYGYAAIRVDIRGTGDSDGILRDEYLLQEQTDGVEVISWIARQKWCTGSVGLFGISWGGFNGLQIATRKPPELKAVISLCASDDRYADDVHYMGGCVLGLEMLPWASTMLAYNAAPPNPHVVGKRWRSMWLKRLRETPPFIETWMTHQRRDAYWKQGSVCEDPKAILCPVFLVGGWNDAYTNAIPRLLKTLTAPRRGLIGPWSHAFPFAGHPGPNIGFLQECLRWFDHWLTSVETGIMSEPMLRVWLEEGQKPIALRDKWRGRWISEDTWPSPHSTHETWYCTRGSRENVPSGRLQKTPPSAPSDAETYIAFKGKQTMGLLSGAWCPYGLPGEFPLDQRQEDAQSLSFTSSPLAKPLHLLGFPEVVLTIRSSERSALLSVRLCDVFPDGSSALISKGLLNLTHHASHEHPSPLTPHKPYRVRIPLNALGYSVLPGNRLRIALSPTYWPHAWPSPKTATLEILPGLTCMLRLPIRNVDVSETKRISFPPPEAAQPLPFKTLRDESYRRTISRDPRSAQSTLDVETDSGRIRLLDDKLEYDEYARSVFRITDGDPLSADVDCYRTFEFKRGTWDIRIAAKSTMHSDDKEFHIINTLTAYEGEKLVFSQTKPFRVTRDLV